jgi:hypothetical protein
MKKRGEVMTRIGRTVIDEGIENTTEWIQLDNGEKIYLVNYG